MRFLIRCKTNTFFLSFPENLRRPCALVNCRFGGWKVGTKQVCSALSNELRRSTLLALYPDLRFISGRSLFPILTASVVKRSNAFLCGSYIVILNLFVSLYQNSLLCLFTSCSTNTFSLSFLLMPFKRSSPQHKTFHYDRFLHSIHIHTLLPHIQLHN